MKPKYLISFILFVVLTSGCSGLEDPSASNSNRSSLSDADFSINQNGNSDAKDGSGLDDDTIIEGETNETSEVCQSRGLAAPILSESEIPDGFVPIRSVEDFDNIRNNLSQNYILMNDIDLAGQNFQPLGSYESYFSNDSLEGVFEGNGYTIRNWNYIGGADEDYVGLFRGLSSGEVRNLVLENFNVQGNATVGALAGISFSRLDNIHVRTTPGFSGSIRGNSNVGGLVGTARGSAVISNISIKINVIAEASNVGGVSGASSSGPFGNSGPSLERVYFDGRVEAGANHAGGLIGNAIATNISDSCVEAEVEGLQLIGGVVGDYFTFNPSAGYSTRTMRRVRSAGRVFGDSLVGGIAGRMRANVRLINSYSFAEVEANIEKSGGLVGEFEVTEAPNALVKNTFFAGSLSGAAMNKASVIGFIRYTDPSFDDIFVTENIALSGSGLPTYNSNGSSLQQVDELGETEMKTPSNYIARNFDDEVWEFELGEWPLLQFELPLE